jgi:hypothetical protein
VIRKGEPWGRPVTGPPDLEVRGGDADLAAAVQSRTGARVRFAAGASSDLALAVGIADGSPDPTVDPERLATELPVDGLVLDGDADGTGELAVNMVVLGPPPDRLHAWHRRRPCRVEVDGRVVFDAPATTVVVANGQFLRGLDVVPRGHPGDGRCEVQVYSLGPTVRRAMRGRLPYGEHLPHPDVRQHSGRTVTVHFASARPLEVDGRTRPSRADLTARVVPEALVLLV